jgi:tRNA modification GTPase
MRPRRVTSHDRLSQGKSGTHVTSFDDTIAAIATPLGESALAVLRLSGRDALAVADAVFRPTGSNAPVPSAAPSHTLHYGKVLRGDKVIDEVMLAVLRAPRTFTREDMVEISCHGGILAAKLILDVLLENGARLALPGEFTKRAFLNGRLDLAQAEAVADLIHSRTELALSAAHAQLEGKLSQQVNKLRNTMLTVLAHVEAHIDFPDEDIAPDTLEQLQQRLRESLSMTEQLLRTADEGQLLRRGIRVAIAGRPNVGKSSLLNQLLGHDRAIVSPIAGTTRDTIEEMANIRGVPVVFTDTAGLRDAQDLIEKEGVRRTQQTVARAELVLYVLDNSEPFTEADAEQMAAFPEAKRIVVCNKADLPSRLELPEAMVGAAVAVSSLTGAGLDRLKDAIAKQVWAGRVPGEMTEVMINSRHQEALKRARTSSLLAAESLTTGASLELVAVDLRQAVSAVGEIVGKTSTEDLLDSIFSQFCIGK